MNRKSIKEFKQDINIILFMFKEITLASIYVIKKMWPKVEKRTVQRLLLRATEMIVT